MDSREMDARAICVLGGLAMLAVAVSGAITGRAFGKYGRVDRIRQPIGYWVVLVSQFAAAALFRYAITRL
jgi:hypothetical protein